MANDLILTLNAGSSTVKLGFYEAGSTEVSALASGTIDFRDEPFEIRLKRDGQRLSQPLTAKLSDPNALPQQSFDWLAQQFDLSRLTIIGHRVVHRGDIFSGPALITDEVLDQIKALAQLAPLHQPQSLRLMGSLGKSLEQVETMLYRESGLLGVSGFSADSRELIASNRSEAAEAIALFCHRIAGEVARLATTLRGLDALVIPTDEESIIAKEALSLKETT